MFVLLCMSVAIICLALAAALTALGVRNESRRKPAHRWLDCARPERS